MQDTKGENVWNRKCQVPGVGDEMSTTPKGKRMEDGYQWRRFVETSRFVRRMS